MAEAALQAQQPIRGFGSSKCPYHFGQEVIYACEDCRELACVKCATSRHRGHVLDDLSEIIPEVNRNLQDCVSRLEQIDIPHINKSLKAANDDLLKKKQYFKKEIQEKEEERRSLKKQLENVEQSLKALKDFELLNVSRLQNREQQVRSQLDDQRSKLDEVKDALRSGSNVLKYDVANSLSSSATEARKVPLTNEAEGLSRETSETDNIKSTNINDVTSARQVNKKCLHSKEVELSSSHRHENDPYSKSGYDLSFYNSNQNDRLSPRNERSKQSEYVTQAMMPEHEEFTEVEFGSYDEIFLRTFDIMKTVCKMFPKVSVKHVESESIKIMMTGYRNEVQEMQKEIDKQLGMFSKNSQVLDAKHPKQEVIRMFGKEGVKMFVNEELKKRFLECHWEIAGQFPKLYLRVYSYPEKMQEILELLTGVVVQKTLTIEDWMLQNQDFKTELGDLTQKYKDKCKFMPFKAMLVLVCCSDILTKVEQDLESLKNGFLQEKTKTVKAEEDVVKFCEDKMRHVIDDIEKEYNVTIQYHSRANKHGWAIRGFEGTIERAGLALEKLLNDLTSRTVALGNESTVSAYVAGNKGNALIQKLEGEHKCIIRKQNIHVTEKGYRVLQGTIPMPNISVDQPSSSASLSMKYGPTNLWISQEEVKNITADVLVLFWYQTEIFQNPIRKRGLIEAGENVRPEWNKERINFAQYSKEVKMLMTKAGNLKYQRILHVYCDNLPVDKILVKMLSHIHLLTYETAAIVYHQKTDKICQTTPADRFAKELDSALKSLNKEYPDNKITRLEILTDTTELRDRLSSSFRQTSSDLVVWDIQQAGPALIVVGHHDNVDKVEVRIKLKLSDIQMKNPIHQPS